MDKQEIIERIMELRADGLSYQQIADRFNADGIPTTSGAGRWHKGTVGRLAKEETTDKHPEPDKQSNNDQIREEVEALRAELNTVKQSLSVHLIEELNTVRQERDRLKEELAVAKQELAQYHIPTAGLKVGAWNIQKSGGYYRAFRKHNGKQIAVYIGRRFDPADARKRIMDKHPDIGVD